MAWIKQKIRQVTTHDRLHVASSRQSAPPQQHRQQHQQPQRRERKVADRPANIGQSVQIKGDLTGQEDLTIEGRLEGKVLLDSHQLTIGANGHIQGEIRARSVIVVGELIGNINADEKVEVAASGSMQGQHPRTSRRAGRWCGLPGQRRHGLGTGRSSQTAGVRFEPASSTPITKPESREKETPSLPLWPGSTSRHENLELTGEYG